MFENILYVEHTIKDCNSKYLPMYNYLACIGIGVQGAPEGCSVIPFDVEEALPKPKTKKKRS